jgi:hypothetical protein
MVRILGSTGSRRRRTWLALGTVAALTLLAIPGTSFANLTGSTFEGNDGNLVVNTAGNTDWANAPNRVVGLDQPSGSTDNSFGQGTKEDNVNATVVTGSIPPNKNDLTRFYVGSEFASGSNFLYLAWERAVNIGNANLDLELNQNATAGFTGTTTGPVTLNRTAGDILITYDFSGSGTPTLGLLKWVTSGPTSQCFSSNSLPCWGNRVNLSAAGSAEGAVNTGTVTDPVPPNAPRTLTTGLFGEAAVNLTAAGVFPAGTCEAFGSTFLKSRASSSFGAEVKDFIAPQPVNISNCGTVNIHKQDDIAAPLAGAVFTLFADNAPLDGSPPHGAEDIATSLTCTTNASGDCSITSVPFGNYWAVETTGVPNHDLAADQSFSLTQATPNLTISLTFVDPRQPGAIQVTKTRKHAADGPGSHPQAGVSFTVNGVTKQTDANGVVCFDGLDFGSYTVHETVPAGYHVDANDKSVTVDNSASCNDATYVGETVSFHNTPLTDVTVSVDSQVNGGTSSTITCGSSSASTDPTGDGSLTLSNNEPGSITCTIVIDP